MTTFVRCYSNIKDKNPYAADMFSLCSFLASPVPFELFSLAHKHRMQKSSVPADPDLDWIFKPRDRVREWNIILFQQEMSNLTDLSLASLEFSGNPDASAPNYSLRLHQMTRQWGRLSQQDPHRYIRTATSLLHDAAMVLQGTFHRTSSEAYLKQRWLLVHIDECSNFSQKECKMSLASIAKIEAVLVFSMLYMHESRFDDALELFENSLSPLPDDLSIRQCLFRDYAYCLRKMNRCEEAISNQENAIMILKELRDSEDDMLLARTELAVILRDMRKLDKAIHIQNTVVHRRKEFDGIKAATTRDAISCLAVMYYAKKDYEEARRLEEMVLDDGSFGTDAASLAQRATWMRNLAITYCRLKMYEKAIELEIKVLAVRRSLFGDYHLETAGAMDALAVTLQLRNRLDEAEQLFTEALSVRIQKLGERHKKTQKTRKNLSNTMKLAGKL